MHSQHVSMHIKHIMPANTPKMMTLYELKAALNWPIMPCMHHNTCYVPTNIQISEDDAQLED